METSENPNKTPLSPVGGQGQTQTPERRHRTTPWLLVIAFVFLTTAVAGLVWHDVRRAYDGTITHWRVLLTNSADDQVGLAALWLREREMNAEFIAGNPSTIALLTEGGPHGKSAEVRGSVERDLKGVTAANGLLGGFVLDLQCRIAANGGAPGADASAFQPVCARVYDDKKFHVIASGLNQDDVRLSIAFPVFAETKLSPSGERVRVIRGMVLLAANPWKTLLPFVAPGGEPAKSIETALAWRRGNNVVVFFPSRAARGGKSAIVQTLNDSTFEARVAAGGNLAFGEFTDYRGVRVFGVAKQIPLAGDYLARKIDRDEALAEFHRQLVLESLAGTLVIILFGFLAAGVHRRTATRELIEKLKQKEALLTLQKDVEISELRYRDLFENANDAIIALDLDSRIVSINKSGEHLSGYSRDEAVGMSAFEIIAPECHEHLRQMLRSLLEGKRVLLHEVVIVAKDGHRVFAEVNRQLMYRDAKPVGMQVIARDISERKRAEKELQAEKDFSEAVMASLPGAFFVIDQEGRLIRWNKGAENVGYSGQQLQGMEAHSVVAPEERSHIRARWQQAFTEGSSTAEAHIVTTDGVTIPYLFTAQRALIGSNVYVIGTGIDITERKRMTEALSQSEQRYREFISHTAEGVWRVEFKQSIPADLPEDEVLELMRRCGYLAECNDAWARIIGAPSAAGLVGARFDELIPQSDSQWDERVRSLIRSGFKSRTLEFHYTDRQGLPRDVQRTDIPIVENGMLKRWWGITRDITERKQAGEALRQSELRFRGLVENSPLPMLITTVPPEERILLMNRRFTELFGYTLAEVPNVEDWWPRAYPEATQRERVRREWEENIAKAKAAGRDAIDPVEAEIACLDGSRRQVEVHLNMYGDGALVIFNDLTDRKKAEQAVRESEELFRQMAVNSPYAFILWDVRTERHVYINPAYETIWGQTIESLYADLDGWKKGVHPEDRARMERRVLGDFQSNPEREGIEDEFRIIRPDGSIRWAHMNRFPVRNELGEVYRIGCVAQDITDRKQAAEALRVSEERFRQMAENSPYMFWLFDLRLEKLLYVSPAYEKIWGRKIDDLYAYPRIWREALHPEDRQRVAAEFDARARTEGDENEYRILLPDGSVRWLHGHSFPLRDETGQVDRLAGIVYDITDRKRAEADLQREKAFSETIIDSLPGLFYIVDQRGEVIRWNRNTEQILGYSKEELDASQTFDVIAEEDRDLLAAKWQRAFAEGSAVVETHLLTKQGRKIPFLLTALRAVIDEKIYVVGTGIDISERKEAEEALQEEKAFTDAVIDSLPGAFFVTDPSARIVRWNKNAEKMLGYSGEELAALGPMAGIAVEERSFIVSKRQEVIAGSSAMTEVNLLAKDGKKIPCLLRGTRVVQGEDTYVVGMAIDITERKRAEEALRQREMELEDAQRLAQVGSWVWDVKTDSLLWSKELYRISGLDPKLPPPSYSKDFPQRYSPGTWKQLNSAVENAVQTGAPFQLEMEIKRLENPPKWVIARGEAVCDSSGRTQQVRGTVQDITDRKLSEESLRQREKELEEAQRLAKLGSWAVDIATRAVTFSIEHYRILGLDPNGPPPSTEEIAKYYSPETWEEIAKAGTEAYQTGKPFKRELPRRRRACSRGRKSGRAWSRCCWRGRWRRTIRGPVA